MKIGIFGLPNSGKSQFRRWLVTKLRAAGINAEHWDADCFAQARFEADKDMRKPDENSNIVWLIEDVRGTTEHKEITSPGEKHGAWKPLSYYDLIIYLDPDWPIYASFWVSRALQWKKTGAGNWQRESGWKDMDDEDKIVSHVRYYLEGRQKWQNEDNQLLTQANYTPPTLMVKPTWNNAGALCWNLELYDILVLIHAHNDRQT